MTDNSNQMSGTDTLYLKYRPRKFKDVIGQEVVTESLRKAIASGKGVPHAMLLSGDRGCGKTTTARIIAAALNCEDVVDGEPCGECGTCEAIMAGNLPGSVQELNSADNRGIDAMKEVLSGVALAPQTKFKVYIFDEVHMLTKEASSTLLKYLEEPPNSNVIFILATTDAHKLLDTIRSRTTPFMFQLFNRDNLGILVDRVCEAEGIELTEGQRKRVIANGRGSGRDTLSQLQMAAMGMELPDNGNADDIIPALVESVLSRNLADAMVAIAESDRAGTLDARYTSEGLLSFLRDALLYQADPQLVNSDELSLNLMAKMSKVLSDHVIVRNIQIMSDSLAGMRTSGSGRIALEGGVARMISDPVNDQYNGLVSMIRHIGANVQTLSSLIIEQQGEGANPDLVQKVDLDEDLWANARTGTNSTWPQETQSESRPSRSASRRRARGSVSRSSEAEESSDDERPTRERRTRRRTADSSSEETTERRSRRTRPSDDEEDSRPVRRRRTSSEDEKDKPRPTRSRRSNRDEEPEGRSDREDDKPESEERNQPSDDQGDQEVQSEETDQDSAGAGDGGSKSDNLEANKRFEEALDLLTGRNKMNMMSADWSVDENGKFTIITATRLSAKSQEAVSEHLGGEVEFKENE